MDLDRIRKLAGLPSGSVVAPSQLHEKQIDDVDEVLSENTDVDFSTKQSEVLTKLEAAISENGVEIVTLGESAKDAHADIDSLGLTKVGTVTDLGNTVFNIYEDVESALWFQHTADMNSIHQTSMVMETLKTFHTGEDVEMRDVEATAEDDAITEGDDTEDRGMTDDDHAESIKAGKAHVAKLKAKVKSLDKSSKEYETAKAELDRAESEEQ